jgi:hypothetical protein
MNPAVSSPIIVSIAVDGSGTVPMPALGMVQKY